MTAYDALSLLVSDDTLRGANSGRATMCGKSGSASRSRKVMVRPLHDTARSKSDWWAASDGPA